MSNLTPHNQNSSLPDNPTYTDYRSLTFDALARRYPRWRGLIPNRADQEELVQDILCKTVKDHESGLGAFTTLLYQVAPQIFCNALNYRRYKKRDTTKTVSYDASGADEESESSRIIRTTSDPNALTPFDDIYRYQEGLTLKRLLARATLSTKQKITLSRILDPDNNDLNDAQIADKFGMSKQTYSVAKQAVIKRLKAAALENCPR